MRCSGPHLAGVPDLGNIQYPSIGSAWIAALTDDTCRRGRRTLSGAVVAGVPLTTITPFANALARWAAADPTGQILPWCRRRHQAISTASRSSDPSGVRRSTVSLRRPSDPGIVRTDIEIGARPPALCTSGREKAWGAPMPAAYADIRTLCQRGRSGRGGNRNPETCIKGPEGLVAGGRPVLRLRQRDRSRSAFAITASSIHHL